MYAHIASDARHVAAREWWQGLLSGSETVGIPLAVSIGFVRLVTTAAVVAPLPPMSSVEAIAVVQGWFERPHFIRLDSGPDHFTHMARCLAAAGRAGKLVTDAQVPAFALDYDAEIHTADGDFRLFPEVCWRNPL